MSKWKRALGGAVLAGALVLSAVVLVGCGCSRDKDGDDVKQTTEATPAGEWRLTEAMDQNNNKLDIDASVKTKTYVIIKADMTGTMAFADGTYLGTFARTPEADMTYQDAWGQYSAEAYTFTNQDQSVEIEFAFVVRKDGSQAPFLRMDIGNTSYYYDR